MGIVHSRNTLTYPRIFFGNYWQLLATFGNYWQLLATFGYFWQLFATIGNFGQYMSWDDMSRDKMSPDRLTMVMMRLTLVMMRLTMVMMTKHFLHSFVLYCIEEPSFVATEIFWTRKQGLRCLLGC